MRVSRRQNHRAPFFPRPVFNRTIRVPTGAELVEDRSRREALVEAAKAETERLFVTIREVEEYLAYVRKSRREGRKPRLAPKPIRETAWNLHLVT